MLEPATLESATVDSVAAIVESATVREGVCDGGRKSATSQHYV